MTRLRSRRLQLGLLFALCVLALAENRLKGVWQEVAAPPQQRRFAVTNGGDAGDGTLRAALVAAAMVDGRAEIEIEVERIEVLTALPPLVNPRGVIVTSTKKTVIDAEAVESGAVIVVAASGSTLRGIAIRGSRATACLQIRTDGIELVDTELRSCSVGVLVEAGAKALRLERCRLIANDIGIRLSGTAEGTVVERTTFRNNRTAGLWKVASSAGDLKNAQDLIVRDSVFFGGRHGMVLFNAPATFEDNQLRDTIEAAILVSGPRVVVRRNRFSRGAVGIAAHSADGAMIDANEVAQHRAIGIILNHSRNTVVRDNVVHGNGFGLVDVLGEEGAPNVLLGNLVTDQQHDGIYIAGSSPVIRDNRILSNRAAGMRLLQLIQLDGTELPSVPLLRDNRIADNATDEPVRGVLDLGAASDGGDS